MGYLLHRQWRCIAVIPAAALLLLVSVSGAQAGRSGRGTRPPRNVAVTDRRPFAYEMPSIAIARGRPLAVSYDEGDESLNCYLALSRDGGAHWHNIALIGPGGRFAIAAGQKQCWEPRVAYSRDGTLYYVYYDYHFQAPYGSSYLYSATVYVTTSRNGGRTFTRPRRVDTTQPAEGAKGPVADDEPRVAADPVTGRVYIAWTRYAYDFSSPSEVMLSWAADGSSRFSKPRVVSRGVLSANVPMIAASGGSVYYSFQDDSTFYRRHPRPNGALLLDVRVSHDGGRRFGPVETVARMPQGCTNNACPEDSHFPAQAIVSAGNRAYLVWSAATGRKLRLHFSHSSDGGRHWSRPEVVGIPPGRRSHHQVRPFFGLAPDGRLDLVYFDQTANQHYENTYLSVSLNGGRSFLSPQRISSASSNTNVHPGGSPAGDFGGNESFSGNLVDSSTSGTFMAWTDSRRGNSVNAKQDVFFAKVVY